MRRAFSLLELIVALAILAVLAGLAFTALTRVRQSAGRADCQNRLRNQALSILNYESHHGHLPPGSISGPFEAMNVPENANHSLWAVLLGELGEPTASAYRWDLNYDDAANEPVAKARIEVLLCPANVDRTAVADFGPIDVNAFLADIGELDPSENFESALPVNGSVRMSQITDGTSNTLLVAEAGGRPGIAWSSPDVTVPVKSILGSAAHLGGANAAMCDGSVRFFPGSTSVKLLAKLATRSGGEDVGDD